MSHAKGIYELQEVAFTNLWEYEQCELSCRGLRASARSQV